MAACAAGREAWGQPRGDDVDNVRRRHSQQGWDRRKGVSLWMNDESATPTTTGGSCQSRAGCQPFFRKWINARPARFLRLSITARRISLTKFLSVFNPDRHECIA
jgi:hypothetical protein